MALNRVSLTINSRMYTIVSEESPEYMAKLGEHINEKIQLVLKNGKNIMGERPIVLAALNICDEYYKKGYDDKAAALNAENTKLKEENRRLQKELGEALSAQVTIAETEAIAERDTANRQLEEAKTQIKFLEGQLTLQKEKAAKLEAKYSSREDRLFDMIDGKKDEKKN